MEGLSQNFIRHKVGRAAQPVVATARRVFCQDGKSANKIHVQVFARSYFDPIGSHDTNKSPVSSQGSKSLSESGASRGGTRTNSFSLNVFLLIKNETFISKETNEIQNLNCYQVIGGLTMIFCEWIGLTVKSSYLVKIEGEMKSPIQSIQRTVECCEITLSGNGLIIGKSYRVIVGPTLTTVFLKGMPSITHIFD